MFAHAPQITAPVWAPKLSARAPNTLKEAISLCQSVHRVVALAHSPYEAAECECVVLAGVAAVLVNLAD